ncbi:Hypothetical predicted protein [Mytilus galloprovincialis]|uniref:Uncharacterized protein n=1 Tax=Mytilus galloprovincialis TaxID=29158 RepID=A0A8B6C222_MYTGA|nr:Hypothetical predicted protein [Mytilus galloprovincialis]
MANPTEAPSTENYKSSDDKSESECISLSNLELIVQRKFDKFKEEILKESRSALSGLINDNEKLRTEVVNLNNKNKELEKNQLELKSEINTIKTEIEKKDMEVDENQNESQNQNEIALLGVTIDTYNIELTKIKNDIDMYNKTNDQALENIRTDLTMLKSSQKDEIESFLTSIADRTIPKDLANPKHPSKPWFDDACDQAIGDRKNLKDGSINNQRRKT